MPVPAQRSQAITRIAAVAGSSGALPSVAFNLVGSDIFPVNMFHWRRGLVGGTLARAWVAFDVGGTTYVVTYQHGGSYASPVTFVPALAGATEILVDLGASSVTAAQVATATVNALDGVGLTAAADSGTVTVQGGSNLVIPPAVTMTDTSLRGFHGMRRNDWGDGGVVTLNQNGGTGGTGSVSLGSRANAGRVIAVYVWTRTDAPTSIRLMGSSGPVYAYDGGDPTASPGTMARLMQGVATVQGFGGITGEVVGYDALDNLWAQYRSDTGGGGIRFRAFGGTPVGRGTLGENQRLFWDTTASASSATEFPATYDPTVNNTFEIYVGIGVVYEEPDGDGNYPADGSLTARIGDQSDDAAHGTQTLVGPEVLDVETTHHRQVPPPWTAVVATSVTRVVNDTAAGEDSRAVLYAWDDLNLPSTTPAPLIADLGPMGFGAGTGNRAVTNDLGAGVPVGSEVLTANYWSLGFNYVTVSGDPLVTMVLPVFLDAPTPSSWLSAWTDGPEWHDDIRGASEYALPSGVTEYRTLAPANAGMPTTTLAEPFPDPMSTDASDDSPSAIAMDWLILERPGITAVT